MLNFCPSFCVNMILKLDFIFINAHSYYSKPISPFRLSFLKHFLIMCHWLLAWNKPCCPEVNKPNFPFFMLEIYCYFFIKWNQIFYWFIFRSCSKINDYTYFYIFNVFYNFLRFLIKLSYIFRELWSKFFIDINI